MDSFGMLMEEAKRLARGGTLLKGYGEGPPAAYWLSGPSDDVECIAFNDSGQWRIVVPTADGLGRCEPVELVAIAARGIPLFAHPYESLPPLDAIFQYGPTAIDEYLDRNNWTRSDPFNGNFSDPAAHAYQREWSKNCPLYGSDAYAVQGGWHYPWPEGDFEDLTDARLLVWTLAESEPWIEVFEKGGRLEVLQRIT